VGLDIVENIGWAFKPSDPPENNPFDEGDNCRKISDPNSIFNLAFPCIPILLDFPTKPMYFLSPDETIPGLVSEPKVPGSVVVG